MSTTLQHVDLPQLAEEVRAAQLPPVAERQRIRRTAGVTVREAAAAVGVSPMTLLRWEHGTRCPRRRHALAYGRLLAALDAAVTS